MDFIVYLWKGFIWHPTLCGAAVQKSKGHLGRFAILSACDSSATTDAQLRVFFFFAANVSLKKVQRRKARVRCSDWTHTSKWRRKEERAALSCVCGRPGGKDAPRGAGEPRGETTRSLRPNKAREPRDVWTRGHAPQVGTGCLCVRGCFFRICVILKQLRHSVLWCQWRQKVNLGAVEMCKTASVEITQRK